MRFVWHEPEDVPCPSAALVIRTNHLAYHVAVVDTNNKWWIRTGKRYSEIEKVISGNEKITGWAYIGGES